MVKYKLVAKAYFGHGCEGPPGLAHGEAVGERDWSFREGFRESERERVCVCVRELES